MSIKRILGQNLNAELHPEAIASPPASIYVRSARELLGPLMEAEPWSCLPWRSGQGAIRSSPL
jgi:hypothetical protein